MDKSTQQNAALVEQATAFHDAVFKIRLGDKPVDASLKPQLPGSEG